MLGAWMHLGRPVWILFRDGWKLRAASLTFLVLAILWAMAVWALFGGAISRVAAVQLAADERIGWVAALRFAASKWLSYFAAPLLPLLGVVLVAIPLAVLGLLVRWNFGVLLAGVLWPLALLGGLVMALLLLGLAFGWPLMWATISTEGTDSFDALSRSLCLRLPAAAALLVLRPRGGRPRLARLAAGKHLRRRARRAELLGRRLGRRPAHCADGRLGAGTALRRRQLARQLLDEPRPSPGHRLLLRLLLDRVVGHLPAVAPRRGCHRDRRGLLGRRPQRAGPRPAAARHRRGKARPPVAKPTASRKAKVGE